MWKKLSVCLLLLALALSPLAAWPTWLTGEPQGELQLKQELEQVKAENKMLIEEKASLTLYIENLENLLTEQEADLNLLLGKAEASERKAANLEKLLIASQSEIQQSKALSNLSSVDSKDKQDEIANLEDTIVTVQTENVELYAENKSQSAWGGIIGAGVVYDPTGQLGATLDMGVRYNKWALVVGAEYRPSEWKLEIPSMSELSFSTGLQYSF